MAIMVNKSFNDSQWDQKSSEWKDKSFYYIPILNIMNVPMGLSNKLETLYRDVRKNGYRTVNNMILIQYKTFGGRVMIEVEKQDKYDSQVATYEMDTTADTMVYSKSSGSLGNAVKLIKERVASRRGLSPREIYYWMVNGPGSEKTVVFAIS